MSCDKTCKYIENVAVDYLNYIII